MKLKLIICIMLSNILVMQTSSSDYRFPRIRKYRNLKKLNEEGLMDSFFKSNSSGTYSKNTPMLTDSLSTDFDQADESHQIFESFDIDTPKQINRTDYAQDLEAAHNTKIIARYWSVLCCFYEKRKKAKEKLADDFHKKQTLHKMIKASLGKKEKKHDHILFLQRLLRGYMLRKALSRETWDTIENHETFSDQAQKNRKIIHRITGNTTLASQAQQATATTEYCKDYLVDSFNSACSWWRQQ